MECACIGSGYDNSDCWDFEPSETFPVARKNWKCQECGAVIGKGEQYYCFSGKSDGDWILHRTCMDCHSVTENLFCTWTFSQVWTQLRDNLRDSAGEISWSKLAKLTPIARDKVCSMIEDVWGDIDQVSAGRVE